MNIKKCIDELLVDGADDWVYLAALVRIVELNLNISSDVELREITIGIIREVVQQGLMEIGDLLGEDDRFRKWDMSDQEALEKVEREWIALGRNPSLGDICWLANTKKGDEIGNKFLDQGESHY